VPLRLEGELPEQSLFAFMLSSRALAGLRDRCEETIEKKENDYV
jgi:hypothetical protein